MIIGYVRVSTAEQSEDRQIRALEAAGAEKIYAEKLSAKTMHRPQLLDMLDYAREGDTVIVAEFSRLARSTKDLLDIIERLRSKGVAIKSLTEAFDTATPTGELMLTVIGAIATFERRIMLQRQAEGIAIAKEQGKYKGRAKLKKPPEWDELRSAYMTRKIRTVTALARRCGCSTVTVRRWLREPE